MDLTPRDNANSPEPREVQETPVLVFLERAGKIVFASNEARQMLGLTAGDWVPRPVEDVLWGFARVVPDPKKPAAGLQQGNLFRATLPSRSGRQYLVEGIYTIIATNPREAVMVVTPIIAAPAPAADAGSDRAVQTRLVNDVLASLPDAVAIEYGDLLHINPSFTRMFGFTAEETSGKTLRELVVPETRLNEHAMLLKMVKEQGRASMETVRLHKSGELMDVSMQVSPLIVEGMRVGQVYSFRDIGERKETEARLQHDAMHDVLTGLPNRALFQDRLTLALSRRARRPDQSCGVLYLDLDGFKEINDGLGHAAGDVLLQSVAERIANVLRPQDSAARLGGDEFAVLVENISSAGDLEIVGNRILNELDRPFQVFEHEIRSVASIGAAMAGPEHTMAELLIRDADYAMYRAKQAGGSRLEIYDRHLEVCVSSQQERERELRTILENRLFELWYQPVFRLTDGKLEGFETSLAWRRADGTIENSRDLIDVAEETGLSITLLHEVLEAVCVQLRQWADLLPQANFYVSVNLTLRQFYNEGLLAQLTRAVSSGGIDPLRLVLEVPEIVLNEEPDSAIAVLQRIVDSGVRVAMDEFGSSLAPLNHLVRLPIDLLKLDGKLTAAADAPGRQQALLETLVRLSGIVGLQVVAQGIETAEQLDALLQMGCLSGQGPMLAGPLDAARAFKLAEGRAGSATARA